jgi:integrase
VQAALLTGARYGELGSIRVQDVDIAAATVWLMDTKAGKPRVIYLEAEGQELFKQAVAGKAGGDLVFARPDGAPWKASQQSRPLRDACARAKIVPAVGFHDLRRTYGARLAVKGVPMTVIAEALGHADDRVTRRHYAHLAPSYVADTIRANVVGLGIIEKSNLVQVGAK